MVGKIIAPMACAAMSLLPTITCGQTISCPMGEGPYHGPFERSYCSTQYCGHDPESWARGSADLNKATGELEIRLQLETDSVAAGPTGKATVQLEDAGGKVLATYETQAGIGGKSPGKSRIDSFPKADKVPPDLVAKVTSLHVIAQCTGKQGGLLGTPISTIGIHHSFNF
jgi:hypothetical protein